MSLSRYCSSALVRVSRMSLPPSILIVCFGEEDAVPAAVVALVAVEDGSGSERCYREVWFDVGALASGAESRSHQTIIIRMVLSLAKLLEVSLRPFRMERVQKILARRGYCSRRRAEELIGEGRVMVNGQVISLGDQAEDTDEITVNGELVEAQRLRYIAFHKPEGVVTALSDAHEKTIFDDLAIDERVVPVGRLDKWTSGLLILTNDGDFANRIAHPRYELEKEYVVSAPHPIEDNQVDRIGKGVVLDDGPARPVRVFRLDENRISIVLHEGRNRIVRRMCESVGIKLNGLVRVRVGSVRLDVDKGEFRDLSAAEIRSLVPDTSGQAS